MSYMNQYELNGYLSHLAYRNKKRRPQLITPNINLWKDYINKTITK
ncbi:hypothetical protein [Enterococcus avium]